MPKYCFAAGVKQFVMVTSLGTGKVGFPASVLNLFWGVLTEKRKAEVVSMGAAGVDWGWIHHERSIFEDGYAARLLQVLNNLR
jgi:hypothetical protein